MINMATKICTKCGEELTIDMFHKAKGGKYGVRACCKECNKGTHNEYSKQYYIENKEKQLKQQRLRYLELHPIQPKEVVPKGYKRCCKCNELLTLKHFGKLSKSKDGFKYECKNCRIEYYQENIVKIAVRRKRYYENNREIMLEKLSVYRNEQRENNKDWNVEYKALYYQENKVAIKKRTTLNHYARLKSDIGYKLLCRCRSRIWYALKGRVDKTKRTRELIGCSTDELKEYLENKFTDGMNWDNYGEWHIDHIKPCASFNFTNEEEQNECFNYTNLQPLWAMDNMKKHDKII